MSEKRQHRRVCCVVEAQVWGPDKDVHWDVRLTVIGEGGGFVDTVIPLENGSLVSLKVKDDSGSMEIPGRILYGEPTIGSAITFDLADTSLRQRIEKIITSTEERNPNL